LTIDTPVLPANVLSVSKIDVALPNFIYLQTARVRIVGPTGLSKLTRCVLDSGIQKSFIRTSFIDALELDVVDQQNLAIGALNRRILLEDCKRQSSVAHITVLGATALLAWKGT